MNTNYHSNEAYYHERVQFAEAMRAQWNDMRSQAHTMVATASDRAEKAQAEYTAELEAECDNAALLEHLQDAARDARDHRDKLQRHFDGIVARENATDQHVETAQSDLREFYHRTAAVVVGSASEVAFSQVSSARKDNVLGGLNFKEDDEDDGDNGGKRKPVTTAGDSSAAAAAAAQTKSRSAAAGGAPITVANMDATTTTTSSTTHNDHDADDVQRQVRDLRWLAGDDGANDTADVLDLADLVSPAERHQLFVRYIARNIVANMQNVDGTYPYRDMDMDRLFDEED